MKRLIRAIELFCPLLFILLAPFGFSLHTLSNFLAQNLNAITSFIFQVRLWGTSFDNLLWDPQGCRVFNAFLEREFCSENLRFWLAVIAFQFGPVSRLETVCKRISAEFLQKGATNEVNIDGSTLISTKKAMTVSSFLN